MGQELTWQHKKIINCFPCGIETKASQFVNRIFVHLHLLPQPRRHPSGRLCPAARPYRQRVSGNSIFSLFSGSGGRQNMEWTEFVMNWNCSWIYYLRSSGKWFISDLFRTCPRKFTQSPPALRKQRNEAGLRSGGVNPSIRVKCV